METSLRYGGDERHLQLHAKEKFLLDKSVRLQVHGRLDTHTGTAGVRAHLARRFCPAPLARVDVGARFDSDRREMTYDVNGKKTLSLSDGGLLSVDLKGGYAFDPAAKAGRPRAAVELSYRLFNVTDVQDVRLRLGFDLVDHDPYVQIRENNWTLNASPARGWNIIYDL